MKAILIDAVKREVSGIEVELTSIASAFPSKGKLGVEVGTICADSDVLMFYDKNAVLKFPAEFFYWGDLAKPIFGRALVLGVPATGTTGPQSTELTVREVEHRMCFVS